MKKGFYTIGSLIILLISAFVFVFAGAGFGEKNPSSEVAKDTFFGEKIVASPNSNFMKAVATFQRTNENQIAQRQAELEQMLLNYGYSKASEDFSKAVSRQLSSEIYQAVLQRQIINAYAKKCVQESGWIPSDTEITDALKMDSDFYDNSDRFSSVIYNHYVDSNPDMIKEKRSNAKENLYASRFQLDINSVDASKAEVDFINSMNDKNHKRGFKMVNFKYSDYPDSEKAAYGKANPDKFNRYDLSILTFDSSEKANEILGKINNKEITFEDAIKDSDNTYGLNGKYANKYQYLIEKTISNDDDKKAVFALKKGEVSGVIKTDDKYSIFKADSDAVKPDFKSKDTLTAVGNYINAEQFAVIEEYFTKKAEDFSKDAAKRGFATACTAAGVKSVDIAPFPLNYAGTSFYEPVDAKADGMAGAATNEDLLRTIFALSKNEVSKPVVNGRSVLVFQYTKDGEDPKETPSFNAVRMNISRIDSNLIEQNVFATGSVADDANAFLEKLVRD